MSDLEAAHQDLCETFMTCPVHMFKSDLVEVCCSPQSVLTKTILQKGGKAFRVGFENNVDLLTEAGFERASKLIDTVRPRYLWVSPKCGPTSQIQGMNQKTEKQI